MFARVKPMVLAATLLIGCGGGDEEQQPPSSPSSPSSPTFSYEASCCINGAFYQCDSDAAFARCSGGDIAGCHAACDITDPECHAACDEAAGDPDPSQCTRVPAKDGECGSSPSTPSNPSNPSNPSTPTGCDANATGRACDDSDDCGWTNHCYMGQCYEDRSGSPCWTDEECGYVSSCVFGCCN